MSSSEIRFFSLSLKDQNNPEMHSHEILYLLYTYKSDNLLMIFQESEGFSIMYKKH